MEKIETIRDVYSIHIYKGEVEKILAEKEGMYRRKGIECIQEGRYMY